VDSSVHETSYNTGVGADKVNPGQKIFTLRAIGQSGWRGESTRWFQMNFAPDTWFSGPDPNDPAGGWASLTDGNGKRYLYQDFDLTGWGAFNGVPHSMLTQDSLNVLPALRVQRKTFFEVYNNRLWFRAENDTVHLNSWIIIPAGGFDKDSPYAAHVNVPLLPDSLKGFAVYTPGPPNGSPVGFRIQVKVKDTGGNVSLPSETTTYPWVDPASVFHQPVVNGYWGLTSAGKAYAVVRAEDGDGTVDRRVDHQAGDMVGIADRVDAGGGTDLDKALRSKVLTFYVNHVPQLSRSNPAFTPKVNQVFTTRNVFLNPIGTDDDWLDPTRFNKVGGTPPDYGQILRWKVAVLGKYPGTNRDTCYIAGEFTASNAVQFIIDPTVIASGNITMRIRLCDCSECDAQPGTATCPFAGHEVSPASGTCVDTDIPCRLTAPEPESILGTNSGTTPSKPGSTTDPGRRQP
jgi:hypothetical protein